MKTIVIFIVVCSQIVHSQTQQNTFPDSLEQYFRFKKTTAIGFLFNYFPPFLIERGMELKSFIRSKTFGDIRTTYGDTKAIDAMYLRAMQLTENNTGVALFLSTISAFDHKIVGIENPFFLLYFPLTSESDNEFTRRVRNLPTHIYDDSPIQGDRDKIQHFFGSAFLAYIFESRCAAERFGSLIELGEDVFIVNGVLDKRDERANQQGREFGLALLQNSRRLPSEFLKFHIAKKPLPATNRCCTEE